MRVHSSVRKLQIATTHAEKEKHFVSKKAKLDARKNCRQFYLKKYVKKLRRVALNRGFQAWYRFSKHVLIAQKTKEINALSAKQLSYQQDSAQHKAQLDKVLNQY